MIEDLICEFAKKNNLIYGICDAQKISNIILPNAPFVNYSAKQRINPKLIMKNAKSIIVIGCGYNKKISFKTDNLIRGNFSMSCVGEDYHITLKKLLEKLARQINIQFEYKIFVDTGPLNERLLAFKAGLGFIGMNHCIISQKFGSMFFIGYMITDLNLKHTAIKKTETNICSDCKKCVENCPGHALSENGFDYRKCVSYLTQKNEKLLPHEIKIMGKQLYGCDVCQIVCPYNKIYIGEINDINEKMPLIEYILTMSNKKLKEKYKNTAFIWRSNLLKRNAIIALKNSGKIKEVMENPMLKEIIEEQMKKWDIGIAEA
jgi:Uncharacterized Fe-S protein